MKSFMHFAYIITLLILSGVNTQLTRKETREHILSTAEKISDKNLFKVWHYVFEKNYDYNTEAGIKKYKVFKQNLQQIREHNKKGASWKAGLNPLSDLTFAEVEKYYMLQPNKFLPSKRSLRAISLDDYNGDDDDHPEVRKKDPFPVVNVDPVPRVNIDHTNVMRAVKNQGNCGSCWAFAIISVMEGIYNHRHPTTQLTHDWSTQQLVDCVYYGCNGGWYPSAFRFHETHPILPDSKYPYVAQTNECKPCIENSETYTIKLLKNGSYIEARNDPDEAARLLADGPIGVATAVTNNFYMYSSGVFDTDLPENCNLSYSNHAVVIMGYSVEKKAWRVQNSWSEQWGDNGYIWMSEGGANSKQSCYLTEYIYQPRFLAPN